jgi:hypothetical protein
MSKINDQITETNSIISALLVQDSDELKEPVKNHDIKVKKEERVAIIKEFTSRRAFEVFMERKLSEKVLQDGLTAYFSDWSRIRNFLVHHAVVESSEVSNLELGLNDDFLAPAEKKKLRLFGFQVLKLKISIRLKYSKSSTVFEVNGRTEISPEKARKRRRRLLQNLSAIAQKKTIVITKELISMKKKLSLMEPKQQRKELIILRV